MPKTMRDAPKTISIGRRIDGDSWFFWWFNHLPGPSTVDGRNPAPPKEPWNDDSTVSTNKRVGFNHGFKVMREADFVHPQYFP